MRVDIDQAGSDDLAGGINHLARRFDGNVPIHSRHFSAGDGDVAKVFKTLRRVDNSPALDEEVEWFFVVLCRRGSGLGGTSTSSRRSGAEKE